MSPKKLLTFVISCSLAERVTERDPRAIFARRDNRQARAQADCMAAGAEIELKFLFAERDLGQNQSLISAASGVRQPVHQRLRAIYFDTPNCDLWKHGFTLRVRANGKATSRPSSACRPPASTAANGKRKPRGPDPISDLIKNTPLARLAAKSSIRARPQGPPSK